MCCLSFRIEGTYGRPRACPFVTSFETCWRHIRCRPITKVAIRVMWNTLHVWLNTLSSRRNRRHYVKDISKCIFLNENGLISIRISLKFIPRGPINNIPVLVLIMAWRRPGDKPISYLNQWWLFYWRTYASLVLNGLISYPLYVFYNIIYTSMRCESWWVSLIARFLGPTWGLPGSCRPQVSPM